MARIPLRIVNRAREGQPFKQAYMGLISEQETVEEIMENRLKFRFYLRDLYVNRLRLQDLRAMGLK